MASELSREEMEYVIGQAKETASDWVIEHLNKVSDTDAALRQQLIEAERQRDAHADLASEWRRENKGLEQQQATDQLCIKAQANELGRLREQLDSVLLDRAIANNLAESEQKKAEQLRQRVLELDRERQRDAVDGQSALDTLQQQLAAAQAEIIALTDALESGFMKGAYARLSELQHKEQKLYEAEARIRELEQALRLHLAMAADDPILLTPIEVQLVKARALYNELIMSVEKKYQGESRHQTALKYIQRAEQNED